MYIDKDKIAEQLGKGMATLRNWLQEWMSEQEAIAYSEGIEVGIGKTISTLYEAGVDDDTIIHLLNKYWGICWNEAESRLQFEKRDAPFRAISLFLQREGYSDKDAQHFYISNHMGEILLEHPELGKLRNDPAKLVEEIQKLQKDR